MTHRQPISVRLSKSVRCCQVPSSLNARPSACPTPSPSTHHSPPSTRCLASFFKFRIVLSNTVPPASQARESLGRSLCGSAAWRELRKSSCHAVKSGSNWANDGANSSDSKASRGGLSPLNIKLHIVLHRALARAPKIPRPIWRPSSPCPNSTPGRPVPIVTK
jgi:hypothetical protein